MNRKNKKGSEISTDLNSLLNQDKSFQELKQKLSELQKQYKINLTELLSHLEEEPLIPITVFNKKLSALETIVKYLKENKNLTNKQIATLTNRSEKNIWHAYNSSLKKFPNKLKPTKTKYFFPVSIIKNLKLSVLESIVLYLKISLNLSLTEISYSLKRSYKTIWTVYSRSRKKNVK